MLRTLIGATFAAAWIAIAQGCTTPASSADSLLSRMTDRRDREEPSDEVTSRRTDDTSRAESREREPTSVASYTQPSSQQYSGLASQQHAGLDAATLYLIESELRGLPAAERQSWMAYLRTIDPQSVPYVLQTRRRMLDATPGAEHGSHLTADGQFQGMQHGQVPVGIVDPSAVTTGGAMSQMRLEAPEPAGVPVTTPFGPQGQFARPSTEYTQATNTARVPATASNYDATGTLPTISPGAYEHAPAAESNAGMIARTSYETPGNSQAQQLPAGQDAYLQEALQRVIALTEAEIAASNPGYSEQERMDYIRRHVALRMLHFMSEEPHLAQQAIPDVDPVEQEFWTELFWSVSNYFDVSAAPDPAERAALVAAQLASASRHLQHQARLELWNSSFCHRISSFGNFERYDRDEFRAGQPVLLYTEIRNFHSEPTNTGHFRTRLKSHIEIRRGGIDGERIEYNSFPPTEDLCRAPRNDYFHSYKIDLPHHLSPGHHALVLTVEDMLSGKIATEVLDFVVR